MKNILIIVVVLVLGGVAAFYFLNKAPQAQSESPSPEIITKTAPIAPDRIVKPELDDLLPSTPPDYPNTSTGKTNKTSTLTLQQSDPLVLESMGELVGEAEVRQNVVTENVIAKMVATLDALTSRQLSPNHLPLVPPGGVMEVTEDTSPGQTMKTAEGDTIREYVIDPVNERRYTHYVDLLESIDTQDMIAQLQEYQPLFQQAYTDLGYPNAQFKDRLLDVIEHLLQTPVPDQPVRLIKPEAYYLFVDPELEALSAGQKLMIRMGGSNAEKVRSKLLELKAALELADID